MAYSAGRHFLQIPGPTNVPDRVLRAIDHATIDHRGPGFQRLGREVLAGLKTVFQTEQYLSRERAIARSSCARWPTPMSAPTTAWC